MIRYGFLFEKIYDIDNLKLAHQNARKKKSNYKEVKKVDDNIDFYKVLRQRKQLHL
jgi:RNA-directed DNA polymerase